MYPWPAGGPGLDEGSKRHMRKRILVADDLADAASSLAMVCQLYGAQTRIAGDGVEALRIGAEFQPHVVLMDITMPRMDGYEAARRIRAEPWGAGVILVALTGWGRQCDIDTALAAGFDGHLLKPVEAESMLRLIAELSGRRSGGGQAE
jgi:CheY-like chemotaxis protein